MSIRTAHWRGAAALATFIAFIEQRTSKHNAMEQAHSTWQGTGPWERIPKAGEHWGPWAASPGACTCRFHLNPAWGQALLCFWVTALWCSCLGVALALHCGPEKASVVCQVCFSTCPLRGMAMAAPSVAGQVCFSPLPTEGNSHGGSPVAFSPAHWGECSQ